MSSRKIAILLPTLGIGGVEKMRLVLARDFKRRGHSVEFVVVNHGGELLAEVKKEFTVVSLNSKRLINSLIPLIKYLKSHRPDALLVSVWPLTTLAIWAKIFSSAPTRVVVSDHGVLSQSNLASSLWRKLKMTCTMRLSYRFADGIIAVSSGVASDVAKLAGISLAKIKVIWNPAFREKLPTPATQTAPTEKWFRSQNRLITAGRLKAVKDLPTLFRALKKLSASTDAHLLVIGDGECRAEWTQLANDMGISQMVTFLGFVEDPCTYFLQANIFVLSSLNEGFGNVLVEAMSCGLPIVSTDCKFGPREILANGKWGRLVPVGDTEAMAHALETELSTPIATPEQLKTRAKDFSVEKSAEAYLELLV